MFDQVYQSLQKATETTIQMQQEMFKKCFGFWPGFPMPATYPAEKYREIQKKWAETVTETLTRRRETVEAQFKAGLENIEKAFALGEAKTPEELRAKTLELWKKYFESLRQVYDAQIFDFQAGFEKWFELTTKVPA
jgi:hypothetical protein